MRRQTQISSLLKVENLRNEINYLITKSKENIINGKYHNDKKVPIIPLLFINNKFVTNFQVFNECF